MFGDLLSPLHLVLLLIVALLIFGPRRLPELGSSVGKTIKEFQKSMAEARSQVESSVSVDTAATKTDQAGDQKPN